MARCPCNSHVSVPLGYDQTTSGYANADAGLGALWILAFRREARDTHMASAEMIRRSVYVFRSGR